MSRLLAGLALLSAPLCANTYVQVYSDTDSAGLSLYRERPLYAGSGCYSEVGLCGPFVLAPYVRVGRIMQNSPTVLWDVAGNFTLTTYSISTSLSCRYKSEHFSIGPEVNLGLMNLFIPYADVGVRWVYDLDGHMFISGGLYVIPVPNPDGNWPIFPFPMACIGVGYKF